MILAFFVFILSLALLIFSAERFIEGAVGTAAHFKMPPLLIGMVVVGFGTSAPEMLVSAMAAWEGNPGIALGNAFGSNIANIALILGITALIRPIIVHSKILRKELPILTGATLLVGFLLWNGRLTRIDAWILLIVFAILMSWMIIQAIQQKKDAMIGEIKQEIKIRHIKIRTAIFWLIFGLILLSISSRLLIWAAVKIARGFGVSDLIIGLSIVAFGTSLPELASSVFAAIKGEHGIALGNVIGSNLFNTLAVVGIAGAIHPLSVPAGEFSRDIVIMGLLTVSLFVLGYGFRGPGKINRIEGALLFLTYIAYLLFLLSKFL